MNRAAVAYLERGHRSLESARGLIDPGDAVGAVNRAYFTVFYAASASLHNEGDAPRTHAGTHRLFHERFVKSRRFDRTLAKTLRYAYDLRQRADYDAFTRFDTRAAVDLIVDAAAFLKAIEGLISDVSDLDDM